MQLADKQAILCDIGGVLYVGDRPIPGAIEAVARIKAHYPIRFLTNTTQQSGADVVKKLQRMGFDIDASEVITALDITFAYLQAHKSSAYVVATDAAQAFFKPLETLPQRFVVVADAQENFTYETLNGAFRALEEGATLLASAKNRYFKDSDGKLSMDAGGFVAALEYASGKEATLIGKPACSFFKQACALLNTKPSECVMIGDDISSDIQGAQDCGIDAILVRTGKFKEDDLTMGITPTMILDAIGELRV